MMALLLSCVLLMQNTPTDTTKKADTTAKPDTIFRVDISSPPKTPAHVTLVLTMSGSDTLRTRFNEAKQILPAYEEYVQLFLHYDKEAVKNLVTSDFSWSLPKQHETNSSGQAVKELQEFISGTEVSGTDNMHVTIKKLFIKKDRAVSYVEEKFTTNNPSDRDAKDKTVGTFEVMSFSYKRKHTWRKTKEGWKLQTIENTD